LTAGSIPDEHHVCLSDHRGSYSEGSLTLEVEVPAVGGVIERERRLRAEGLFEQFLHRDVHFQSLPLDRARC
jgi:hypothetical protein